MATGEAYERWLVSQKDRQLPLREEDVEPIVKLLELLAGVYIGRHYKSIQHTIK